LQSSLQQAKIQTTPHRCVCVGKITKQLIGSHTNFSIFQTSQAYYLDQV